MRKICSLSAADLVSQTYAVASPPQVFLRIKQVIDDPTKNVRDIAGVIEYDPGLTSRLLKIVNSSFYSFPSKITSVKKAVTIIGNVELRNLVIATTIIESFSALTTPLTTMEAFWKRSIRCGIFSKTLSEKGLQHDDLESVFICGLLHRIGALAIYHCIPELAYSALLFAKSKGIDEIDAQKALLGFDRYEVGYELVTQWELPEVIAITIKNHRLPQLAESFVLESIFISVADYYAARHGDPASVGEFKQSTDLVGRLLEYSPEQWDEIFSVTEKRVSEVFSLFYGSHSKR